jgi:hypothetical protein
MEITVRLSGCLTLFSRAGSSVECGAAHRKRRRRATVTELSP